MSDEKQKMKYLRGFGSNLSGNVREGLDKNNNKFYQYNIIQKSNSSDFGDTWLTLFPNDLEGARDIIISMIAHRDTIIKK